MPAKARLQFTVRHYECDPLGHVNHAVYVHYFEMGRLEAMAAAGLPFSAIIKQGYAIVAANIFVQYKAPALAEDILEVQSCISHFRGARTIWQQALYRCGSGELLAQAEVNGAFTRSDGGPVRIPSAMRRALETLYLPEAASSSPRRL